MKTKSIMGRPVQKYILFIISISLIASVISNTTLAQTGNKLLDRQIIMTRTEGTIQEMLAELTQSQKINLSYDPRVIPLNKRVILTSQSQSLSWILTQLFSGTEIKFTEFDDLIILSPLKKYTISGFIEDKETGERLIGANLVERHSQKGTVSNNYGFFSLTISEGEAILTSSYVGYKTENLKFMLEKDTTLIIRLTPGAEIEEVAITSQNLRREINSSDISMSKIMLSAINNLPTLLGEGDVLKTMQFIPGIQFGSEASSGLVVRGGQPRTKSDIA